MIMSNIEKKGILYWVMFLNNLMPLNGAFGVPCKCWVNLNITID